MTSTLGVLRSVSFEIVDLEQSEVRSFVCVDCLAFDKVRSDRFGFCEQWMGWYWRWCRLPKHRMLPHALHGWILVVVDGVSPRCRFVHPSSTIIHSVMSLIPSSTYIQYHRNVDNIVCRTIDCTISSFRMPSQFLIICMHALDLIHDTLPSLIVDTSLIIWRNGTNLIVKAWHNKVIRRVFLSKDSPGDFGW